VDGKRGRAGDALAGQRHLRPDAFTDSLPLLLAFAAFIVVGALIVAHRPGNAVGWIFAAIAMLAVAGALAEEYAAYGSATRPGSLPGPVLAGWFSSWPGARPSAWR